jgi:O-antigen/teichoic acid export membrane protein
MGSAIRQFTLLIAMVVARILAMLVAFKYLSIHFGPTGFGKLSQVMAIAALFSTFAGGGLSNGLVREIAASRSLESRAAWLKAAFSIAALSVVVLAGIAIVLFFFGAQVFLDDVGLAWVFILIGVAQIGTAIGNTALAYLSGLNAVKYYSMAGIFGSIFSVLFVIAASHFYGFYGAVAGSAVFALSPSIFAIGFLVLKMPGHLGEALMQNVDWIKIRTLANYSLAMVVAAAAVPMALVHIRSSLGQTNGWNTVGEWQSVARIGDAYIQVFGVLFANFLLPRLSATTGIERRKIMQKFSTSTVVLFLGGGIIFYIFGARVLSIVYSSDFANAVQYVAPQLLADFFKILASFFVFRYVALGRPNIQALGEVIQAIVMLFVFQYLLPTHSGLSAVWSYVAGAAVVLLYVSLKTYFEGPESIAQK